MDAPGVFLGWVTIDEQHEENKDAYEAYTVCYNKSTRRSLLQQGIRIFSDACEANATCTHFHHRWFIRCKEGTSMVVEKVKLIG